MSEDTGFQFTDDAVPRAYEEVLVPRLFEPWALLLLDECNLRPNAAVLDVATGPGTVARVAAKRIGPGGRVVATDISRPMLDVANSKTSSPDSAPITYIESPAAPLGVESALPFAPAGSTDIVARLMGQWLSERLGQQFVIENRPGGGGNIGTEAVVRAPA